MFFLYQHSEIHFTLPAVLVLFFVKFVSVYKALKLKISLALYKVVRRTDAAYYLSLASGL